MKCPAGHDSTATDYCDTCGEAMVAGAATTEGGSPDGALDLDQEPVTGAKGEAAAGASVDSADAGGGAEPCPNCGVPNAPDALFCENCGYDHTTGTLPRHDEPTPDGGPAAEGGSGSGEGNDASAAVAGAGSAGGRMPSASDASNSAPTLDPPWVAEVWIDPQWYAQQESPDPLPSPGLPAVVPLRHTSLLIGRVSQSRGITPDIECGADNGVSRRHAQLTTDGQRWWIEDLASSNGTFLGDATSPPPSTPIPVGSKREVADDDRIYVGSWTRIVLRPAADGEA